MTGMNWPGFWTLPSDSCRIALWRKPEATRDFASGLSLLLKGLASWMKYDRLVYVGQAANIPLPFVRISMNATVSKKLREVLLRT